MAMTQKMTQFITYTQIELRSIPMSWFMCVFVVGLPKAVWLWSCPVLTYLFIMIMHKQDRFESCTEWMGDQVQKPTVSKSG